MLALILNCPQRNRSTHSFSPPPTVMQLTVFFVALLMASCGRQPTGACVRGAGIAATCGDDFSSGQCSLVGGTAFYPGQTCQQLGFSSGSAKPPTPPRDGTE